MDPDRGPRAVPKDLGEAGEDRATQPETTPSFHQRFSLLFDAEFHRLHRLLHRLSGEPETAADVVQEAFVRLYQRGAMPEAPEAWLISVAMNLWRNERSTRARRLRLLTPALHERFLADPPAPPDEAAGSAETRLRVRGALDRIPERERALLLLQVEGYGYRAIATALGLNEASIGVFLARARRAFQKAYEETCDAP